MTGSRCWVVTEALCVALSKMSNLYRKIFIAHDNIFVLANSGDIDGLINIFCSDSL